MISELVNDRTYQKSNKHDGAAKSQRARLAKLKLNAPIPDPDFCIILSSMCTCMCVYPYTHIQLANCLFPLCVPAVTWLLQTVSGKTIAVAIYLHAWMYTLHFSAASCACTHTHTLSFTYSHMQKQCGVRVIASVRSTTRTYMHSSSRGSCMTMQL